MVWPSRSRRGDFEGVSQSYRAAAKAVGGLLLPAGDAWRSAWAIDERLALYSPDGLHPSNAGTYLAAVVTYQLIFEEPAPPQPLPVCPLPKRRCCGGPLLSTLARPAQ